MLHRFMTYLTVLVAVPWASAAGQRTHIEMGKRAVDKYCDRADDMLPGFTDLFKGEEVMAAYYAGCMFPDWAFPHINNQASEDAHWKRYQEPYCKFLEETCPYPWDDEERKRIAFFMGIVCHGMADLPWHFSKEGHDSLLARSFANDRAGHAETEYSYDIFLYQDGIPPQKLIPKLWWPLEDIREVYRRMGTILPSGQLETGFTRTNLMINGGPTAARLSADGLKRKYPWVKDKTEGYYFGGVDHGGALTASWLKYYYARLRGWRYYQSLPTAVAENDDERVYAGCTDVSILSPDPKNNTGGEPLLEVGHDRADDYITFIRFELSDPKPTKNVKAYLWLSLAEGKGERRLEIFPVSRAWKEGIGATNDITGSKGQAHGDDSVTFENGFGLFPKKKALATAVVPGDAPSGHWVQWDVTDLVQGWLKEPRSNHGLAIRQVRKDAAFSEPIRFYSSEAFRTSPDDMGGGFRIALRPVLIIRD